MPKKQSLPSLSSLLLFDKRQEGAGKCPERRRHAPTLNKRKAPSLQQESCPVCFPQGQERKRERGTGSVPRASLPDCGEVSRVAKRGPYQAEGPQHCHAALLGRDQLYQAHGDNDAVENVPPLLEVIVGVKGNDFEEHLSRKEHGEDLQRVTRSHLSQGPWGPGVGGAMTNRAAAKCPFL